MKGFLTRGTGTHRTSLQQPHECKVSTLFQQCSAHMRVLLGLSHQVPLLTRRVFKEARIKFFDKYGKLIPCYDIEPVENTTDTVSLFV